MYLFYVDESGEREYESRTAYFSLCALGVHVQDWKALNTEMLALKKTYFDNIEVEMKSNWLRNPKERNRRYLSLYRITEVELSEFTEKLYDILLSRDIVIIASIINKRQMEQQYITPQHPSSLAYRFLFERVERFLQNQARSHGIMIFDKITELEMEKRGYENLLYRQHLRYMEKGTDFVQVSQIVEGLLFIPSHENNLLQLADLCAYNIYRQFVNHGTEWDSRKQFSNRYDYFAKIESKLYCSADGEYAGYGVKKYP